MKNAHIIELIKKELPGGGYIKKTIISDGNLEKGLEKRFIKLQLDMMKRDHTRDEALKIFNMTRENLSDLQDMMFRERYDMEWQYNLIFIWRA